MLPPKWNHYATSNRALRCEFYKSFDYKEYTLSPILLHYAAVGIKPWYDCPSPNYEHYRKYLKLSGYDKSKFDRVKALHRFNILSQYFKVKLGLLKIKILGTF